MSFGRAGPPGGGATPKAESEEVKERLLTAIGVLAIDPVLRDILRRVFQNQLPFVKEEYAGRKVPAADMKKAIETIFTHLFAANARKPVSAPRVAERARELDKTKEALLGLVSALSDRNGLIRLPECGL
jgi:hypothetical protein